VLTILAAALLAALFLLITPRNANGNFVYWSNENETTIGRAKINGTGTNNSFITGLNDPLGVAVDSKFIYWAEVGTDRIGRANLDGSGVNPNFIPATAGVGNPTGVAVTPTHIYWANGGETIGRANLDGSGPVANFINTTSDSQCGLAADSNFVYWNSAQNPNDTIGRAGLDGSNPSPGFITGLDAGCSPAVDSNFIYWTTDSTPGRVGRASVGGGGATNDFIPNATASGLACGVAVNSQYVFWGNPEGDALGRANINGNAPNLTLVPGASSPCALAAAPSNKITINSVTKNKKKGIATINAKVPGPGQVTLNQVSSPPDPNAVEAGVKQIGLTITQASSFKLAIKPQGKTAKKLNKQIKKQLRKKRKAKAKKSVTVFIHFVPAGVAGVPNTEQLKVTLVKQRKRKKK
jgi:hypothetical protein